MDDKPRPGVVGWSGLIDGLRTLPDRMLAKLPDAMRADPQIQQEIGRLALESLASSAIAVLAEDGDCPNFVPSLSQVLNIGQPNADTVYRSARITPGGSYRLRGRAGSLRMAIMVEVARGVRNQHDLNSLPVDADGHFDVMLSPERPEGYFGVWWKLNPATAMLMIRLVSADWATETEPSLSIERTDQPVRRSRRPAADLETRLSGLSSAVDMFGLMFVDHVQQLRADGYVNTLKAFDLSKAGGLTGQFYYEGAFDLGEDEALILETEVPPDCSYYSLILTNEIYETIDWYNNHSSLNDTQAMVDEDGKLRVIISAADPAVPNWLDTAGHLRGAIQGRWYGCATQPIPSLRKMRLVDVRAVLPAETPVMLADGRQGVIRARRTALQQRSLW